MSLGVDDWIFALTDGLVSYSATDYDKMAQLRW
jgi:ribosomal protein L27